jgi:Peptidase family M23
MNDVRKRLQWPASGLIIMTRLFLFVSLLSASAFSLSLTRQNSEPKLPPIEDFPQQADEITLGTIPHRVYKENDGVVEPDVTESFIFSVVVKEKQNIAAEPISARLEFYSAGQLVTVTEFSRKALDALRGVSFARKFIEEEEAFDLRHYFSVPVALGVDQLVYRLTLRARHQTEVSKVLAIPLRRYEQKTRLIFPVKGRFLVVQGHDFNEPHSRGWSQQFAYDIVTVGPNFEVAKNEGRSNEDYFTWDQEVLSPADGTVVYARNDVPDQKVPNVVNREVYMDLPDPTYTIAGNNVLIEHRNGEYSSLGHLKQGSVRVKAGDRVRQGEVIGRVGSSGPSEHPHLHYQLMAGAHLSRSDGLPSRFDNVWIESFYATKIKVPVPKRGIHLEAR